MLKKAAHFIRKVIMKLPEVPAYLVATKRGFKEIPELKNVVKKFRRELIAGVCIGVAGALTLVILHPAPLLFLGISLGSKALSLLFCGAAFNHTRRAIWNNRHEIAKLLPQDPPEAPGMAPRTHSLGKILWRGVQKVFNSAAVRKAADKAAELERKNGYGQKPDDTAPSPPTN